MSYELNPRDVLLYLSYIYKGEYDQILKAIKEKKPLKDKEDAIFNYVSSLNVKAITIMDDEYPPLLRQIYKPPFVIYYKGDISILNRSESKILGVVGSRKLTKYGYQSISSIVGYTIKKDNSIVVISGLARGADYLGEISAYKENGTIISVLASGLDIIYPSSSSYLYMQKERHLILSEYPLNTPPLPHHFILRNRIIAGLASTILIGEGEERSGTSITANLALENGKNVCCIPTNIFSEKKLCNELIKSGAYLISSSDDLINIIKN